jgi:hypothetical protein
MRRAHTSVGRGCDCAPPTARVRIPFDPSFSPKNPLDGVLGFKDYLGRVSVPSS